MDSRKLSFTEPQKNTLAKAANVLWHLSRNEGHTEWKEIADGIDDMLRDVLSTEPTCRNCGKRITKYEPSYTGWAHDDGRVLMVQCPSDAEPL